MAFPDDGLLLVQEMFLIEVLPRSRSMSTSRSSMNLATLYSASALPRLAAFMYQLNASESGEPDIILRVSYIFAVMSIALTLPLLAAFSKSSLARASSFCTPFPSRCIMASSTMASAEPPSAASVKQRTALA